MRESAASFRDANGRLDRSAAIQRMVDVCPPLAQILQEDDDVIGGLPCVRVSWIAKALVDLVQKGQESCVTEVLDLCEQVLRDFGQDGRDFIGACFAEGIPDAGEVILKPFAGPLLLEEMRPYL